METMDMKQWNPRYLEYCRVNGEADPEKMLERDRATGAVMLNFSLWIQRKWREWYESLGPCDSRYVCQLAGHRKELHQDHGAFDRWLCKETA